MGDRSVRPRLLGGAAPRRATPVRRSAPPTLSPPADQVPRQLFHGADRRTGPRFVPEHQGVSGAFVGAQRRRLCSRHPSQPPRSRMARRAPHRPRLGRVLPRRAPRPRRALTYTTKSTAVEADTVHSADSWRLAWLASRLVRPGWFGPTSATKEAPAVVQYVLGGGTDSCRAQWCQPCAARARRLRR
jgi:hypothetical protein